MLRPVPFIDPARPKPKLKPFKAWRHMQALIADKEDTKQVFHIIEALNGNATRRDFEKFYASPKGPELLALHRDLPPVLDNHEALRKLPENTVARAYVEFMEREGLSAAGLVAESLTQREKQQQYDDDYLWYMNRLRDTHDLYHVLTGYGRDALGEDALLGFSHSQNGGLGVSFIAFMGSREVAKHAPREAKIPTVLKEGRRNGKLAARIVDQDIEALLAEPLDAARERLGIREPVLYKRALKIIADAGLDPALVAA